jgi:WD40 repeat protein
MWTGQATAKPTGLIQSSKKERKMTQLRQTYVTGHAKKLRSLVFNPTSPNLLATCALDGYVKVWTLANAHSYAHLRFPTRRT